MAGMIDDEFPMAMEVETDLQRESMSYGSPIPNCPPVSVGFGLMPEIDGKATKEAGHDCYKDVEYIKIAIPGERNSVYFQPATDRDRKRFPRAYAAFKSRGETPTEGTPIKEWAVISRSVALTLRAAHVTTVEALADIHDTHVDRLGFNARELRAKARLWLDERKGSAASMKVAQEKEALQKQLAAMQSTLLAITNLMTPEQRALVEKNQAEVAQVQMAAASAKQAQLSDVKDVEQTVAAAVRRPRSKRAA